MPKSKKTTKTAKTAKTSKKQVQAEEDNNYIIKLNTLDVLDEEITGYNGNSCEDSNVAKSSNDLVCWNCTCNLDGYILGIPIKVNNGVFYTYGNFCSFGCCSRFVYDNMKENYQEYIPNLNLFKKHLSNSESIEPIKMSPPKYLLKQYGGNMDLDEYRDTNDNYIVKLPPIIPVKHVFEKQVIEKRKIDSKSNLKLYRKKQLNSGKSNITNTMQLKVNN